MIQDLKMEVESMKETNWRIVEMKKNWTLKPEWQGELHQQNEEMEKSQALKIW